MDLHFHWDLHIQCTWMVAASPNFVAFLWIALFRGACAFTVSRNARHVTVGRQHAMERSLRRVMQTTVLWGESSHNIDSLTASEQTVYAVLEEMHKAQFPFRLVVIGNGAILETTSALGPTFKLNQSPKTGEFLTTFASSDQSFEFHLKIAQIKKIVLASKTSPKPMQLFRFLTAGDTPSCSLILADKSDEAHAWFQIMVDKYGGEIEV